MEKDSDPKWQGWAGGIGEDMTSNIYKTLRSGSSIQIGSKGKGDNQKQQAAQHLFTIPESCQM